MRGASDIPASLAAAKRGAIITAERGRPARLGATLEPDGVSFAVVSSRASTIEICLFDPGADHERERLRLPGRDGDVFFGFVPGLSAGALYGLRAHGDWHPAVGDRFDASKLLVDPYALRLDRRFRQDPRLAGPPGPIDTAPLVPRAVVVDVARDARPLPFAPPGLTYEVNVRAFSQRHPDVPDADRGTVRALAAPAILDHLLRLGVETVELMPLAAFIDERHLPPLGLANAWGYNPVVHMAPDPRLAPNGLPDIRLAVEALHARGIRVLLDVVLNHSGESDEFGPTLSCRGLDNALYYRLQDDDPALYVNDTGCGNTFALDRPAVVQLARDALATFVETTGIDGFRYDLAPVMGRRAEGFDPDAPLLRALREDPVLKDRIHVAEPWDLGPGGYQLGQFPPPFLEWQDRFRDDVRRFWRGEPGQVGPLATRLAGSADLFEAKGSPSFGVNFIAAHDGFTLADLVAFSAKHNWANGEENRDGHGPNFSWNNGVEGPTTDPAILEARARDVRAMLATLFVARGTPLLVAGDEFGRSQGGNNNAYAQDNATIWLDWENADRSLATYVGRLAALRRMCPALHEDAFLNDGSVVWRSIAGTAMTDDDWHDPDRRWLGMDLPHPQGRMLVYLNAAQEDVELRLPEPARGCFWLLELQSDWPDLPPRPLDDAHPLVLKQRSVKILAEVKDGDDDRSVV